MTDRTEPCPICKKPVQYWERYPNLLCEECSDRTTDEAGNRVAFYNESISGGCYGEYPETGQPYEDRVCYVDGNKCAADEHRFGGIVIQVVKQASDE